MAGGGGGGTTSSGGSSGGGAAGPGTGFTAAGPASGGIGASGADGGGGGGGGYYGGGGGANANLGGGGGGGGGSDFCAASVSACAASSAPSNSQPQVTLTYTVASAPTPAPPGIWLPLPANGATFTLDQAVNSYFLCADGKGGPGLTSCVDQNGRTAGAPIDTSTLGTHTFTVTATSADGQTTSTTSTYIVIPLPTVSNVKKRHGIVTFDISLPAGGAVDAMATTSFRSFALAPGTRSARLRRFGLAADTLTPALGTIVYGRADITAKAGMVPVIVKQSQAGKLLLRDHRRATIQLVVDYTGTNGVPQTVATIALTITR